MSDSRARVPLVCGPFRGFVKMPFRHFPQSTNSEWNAVFWIGGLAYIVPVIFFWIFGSGEVQPWNEIATNDNDDKRKDDEA